MYVQFNDQVMTDLSSNCKDLYDFADARTEFGKRSEPGGEFPTLVECAQEGFLLGSEEIRIIETPWKWLK